MNFPLTSPFPAAAVPNPWLWHVSDITAWLIWFGIPFLFVFFRARNAQRTMGWRAVGTILAVWAGLQLHFHFLGWHVTADRAAARGNPDYDPAGMGAALLVGGWIFGIIGLAPALLAFWSWKWWRLATGRDVLPQPPGATPAPPLEKAKPDGMEKT